MKKIISIIILLMVMALIGCGSPSQGSEKNIYNIQLYSGGKVVGEWISFMNPLSKGNGVRIYFIDAESGQKMLISGTMIITKSVEY